MIFRANPQFLSSAGGEVRHSGNQRWLPHALFVAWWLIFAIMFGSRNQIASRRGEEPIPWGDALGLGFVDAAALAGVAVAALFVSRRITLRRDRWKRILGLHLLISLGVLTANAVVVHFAVPLVTDIPRMPFVHRFMDSAAGGLLFYLLMLGVGYGFEYVRRLREHELHLQRLETQLSRAQLQALKMQLHPHFLFNTLNSISTLMHRDVRAADRMLARLEDLLRMTLEQTGTHEVPLRNELELLEAYLEIEQTRFGDRLTVAWKVEPDTLNAFVPHLVLQPLVENAIRHGIAPRSAPGRIEIAAHRTAERLVLEVSDNGSGLAAPAVGLRVSSRPARKSMERGCGGVGLANTRARLQQLYHGNQSFELCSGLESGTVARLSIPFRVQHEPALHR